MKKETLERLGYDVDEHGRVSRDDWFVTACVIRAFATRSMQATLLGYQRSMEVDPPIVYFDLYNSGDVGVYVVLPVSIIARFGI